MNKFSTIQELRLEKQKLYLKKEFLEDEIEQDFKEFRESLNPLNMIKGVFQKGESDDKDHVIPPLALSAGSTVLDLILTKLLFNKSSFIKKFVSSSIIRAVGPSLVTKAAPVISSLISNLIEKFSKKNKVNHNFEQSTSSDIL